MLKKSDPLDAIDKLRGPAAEALRAVLAELQGAVAALRCEVMDCVILAGMLCETADVAARGEMPLVRVARVRVTVRLLSAAIVKVDERTRVLNDACNGRV